MLNILLILGGEAHIWDGTVVAIGLEISKMTLPLIVDRNDFNWNICVYVEWYKKKSIC